MVENEERLASVEQKSSGLTYRTRREEIIVLGVYLPSCICLALVY